MVVVGSDSVSSESKSGGEKTIAFSLISKGDLEEEM